MNTRKEYIKTVRRRYCRTKSRRKKTALIDEVVRNSGLKRKSVIRALNRKESRYRKKKSGRKEEYTFDLIAPLEKIWKICNRTCSKNLAPEVPKLTETLEKQGELELTEYQRSMLMTITPYGVDKLLKFRRLKYRGKGLGGTKLSPHLKQLIPIRTSFGDDTKPGDLEIDCVLHCGTTVSGIYAETLNMLDIRTHWNERIVIMRKTRGKIIGAFHIARQKFPFPIKSIDFDNGFEFVNYALVGYCKRHDIKYTRSRSYHKNDQAHIEGKNDHGVRKVFGYKRIEDERIVLLMNDIYFNELRLLTNFFYPTRKLIKKKRIGGKVRKKYDTARTPYQRVLDRKDVDIKVKMKLMQEYKKLNPAKLYRSLQRKLNKFSKMVR